MTTQEKLDSILNVLDDMKAESVAILDVRQKTSVADYFVVCSATSDTHLRSIISKIETKLREQKERAIGSDTVSRDWGSLDYADILVHVMKEDARQYYDLEGLWESVRNNPDLI